MPPHAASAIEQTNLVRTAATGIIVSLVIAALYFGRPILVPFALAILLAFALSPAAELLRRTGLPRVFSIVLTVTTAVLVIAGFGAFVGTQLALLASDLPHYQDNLSHKIESVRGAAASNNTVANVSALFTHLDKAIGDQSPAVPGPVKFLEAPRVPNVQRIVPVQITEPGLSPFQVIEGIIQPLLEPLATLSLAIIFVVFILLQKEDLRNRFISLVGARDLQRTSTAIDDGAERLSRYFLLQTCVNTCVGLVVALGLWACGVPSPALWGLIAAIFRFVPYIGVPAAAAVPLVLALAVDPGWGLVGLVAALYIATEAIAGQAVEPWLYGRNVGLSPVAVLLSAAFWTWVWGPLGLLLSTPLTMFVVVLGRHVEQLRFLERLLGDRPALSPEEHFYLHLLKGNSDELAEHAEGALKRASLASYYDEVAIKGLALAQLDMDRGAMTSDETRDAIVLTVEDLLENLAAYSEPDTQDSDVSMIGGVQQVLSRAEPKPLVLCVTGRGPADQAAASLLKSLLSKSGINTRVISPEDASTANVGRIDPTGVTAICLSYLKPEKPANARFLARRLRKQVPNAPLVAGFWGLAQNDSHYLDWIEATGSDFVACSLTAAVKHISSIGLSGTEDVLEAVV